MKRKLVLLALFYALANAAFAQTAVTLDTAITEATRYFLEMIPPRSKVAIVNFAASGENISEYIVNKLTKGLVDSRQMSIVERHQLDAARAEIKFGMSDEVSDESAVKAAQFVSAGVVVTGSIKPLGKNYYMQLRAIGVESGVSHGMFYQTVQAKDMARLFKEDEKRIAAEQKAERKRIAAEQRRERNQMAGENALAVLETVGYGIGLVTPVLPHFIGAGSTFSTPVLTLSLYNHLPIISSEYGGAACLINYGCDFGLLQAMSEIKDVNYYSFYPNIHVNFKVGLEGNKESNEMYYFHFGPGVGYMLSTYEFPNDTVQVNTLAFDAEFGFKIKYLNLMYNLRTDFQNVNHKATLGFYIPY